MNGGHIVLALPRVQRCALPRVDSGRDWVLRAGHTVSIYGVHTYTQDLVTCADLDFVGLG